MWPWGLELDLFLIQKSTLLIATCPLPQTKHTEYTLHLPQPIPDTDIIISHVPTLEGPRKAY
jgi:hypothetical protein